MKNLTESIIKGLNHRSDIEVVDVWFYTITVMVKAPTFFNILPKTISWDFIKDSSRFLSESLNNKYVFVVLDCEKSIDPQYLIITDGLDDTKTFNAKQEPIDEDEFYENVGFFPDDLCPNKDQRNTVFAMINAKRLKELKEIPDLRKV